MAFPVMAALGVAQLAGSLYGISSSRRQRQRLKEELERRRLGLIQSKNIAIGRIAEGTAAAKAPLEAIAERVRTEESFRDPVLEQSLGAGVRQQFGAQLRQTEATQTSASQAFPQQQLLLAAALSQTLMGSESRRLARRMESTRALTGIYSQLSEITRSGAESAAGLEGQFAAALQNEPIFNQEGNDPLAAGLGGLLSFLQTDTGKEALGGLFAKFQGGDTSVAGLSGGKFAGLGTAFGAAGAASGSDAVGIGGLLEFLRRLQFGVQGELTRYTR